MNRRTILAASLLVLAASGARAEGWSEYRSEDGRTRVRLPGMPAVRLEQISIAPGETAPMTEAVVKQGGTAYLVSYIAYPRRISQLASAEWMLDHFRNKMSAGHTLRAEKPLTAGRSQGRAFQVVEATGAVHAVRLYWVRGGLYQLEASGSAGIEAKPDTRTFLESFEIIPT